MPRKAIARGARFVLLALLFLYSMFWLFVIIFCASAFLRGGAPGVKDWLLSISSSLTSNPRPSWGDVAGGFGVHALITIALWGITWRFFGFFRRKSRVS